jgi:transcriptional regulator with XRE-family HTH domain
VASLGLKLYYLRTREAKLSQQAAADALGIRQATLSHLERGRSMPNHDILRILCEFFDVTPTYLMDDARGVLPRITERWSQRDALLTTGMTLETDPDRGEDGGLLIELHAGDAFYDAEAARVRRAEAHPGRARAALERITAERDREEQELQAQLHAELDEHPRRRSMRREL